MTFALSKFRSFLPAATFAMAAEFLMGLSDAVICGHILGETGLSAVNLMQSVFEIVTFVNAGHNPPVAIRGGKAELLKSRPSLALGAMAGVRYRVGEIQLEPGDGIYLYTDGIVEQPTHRPFDVASGKT